MSGPPVTLSPRRAVIISMIIHEIATNAAKYGALSNASGRVRLDWEIVAENSQPKLRLIWFGVFARKVRTLNAVTPSWLKVGSSGR